MASREAMILAGKQLAANLRSLPEDERIEAINAIKLELHEVSPFKDQPVDCVQWLKSAKVQANDYNPNKVAPPEMRLLERSILADGYTQPIVTHDTGDIRVTVDGFHRGRVGKECKEVTAMVRGYLPVVTIRAEQTAISDRMASTIRHNRARGKHGVDSMTDLVTYLAKKGWDDAKICKELGMDPDEALRFRQLGGLAEAFKDVEFSQAWEMRDDDAPEA